MEITNKFQIFCDMDGVLVDLVRGVADLVYADPPKDASKNYIKAQHKAMEALEGKPLQAENLDKNSPFFKKEARTFLYRVLMNNRHFWMDLNWLPGGKSYGIILKNMIPLFCQNLLTCKP